MSRLEIPTKGRSELVIEGRYEDAIRLIRKENPFPTTCAFICEHPCEARCRRNMIDAAVNIRGLKRVAVDNAGHVAPPECAPDTGKKIAVVGGGGQHIHDGEELAYQRGQTLYFLDSKSKIRFSHYNKDIAQLYKEYFEAPLSHKSHMLLHTDHKAWEMPRAPKR